MQERGWKFQPLMGRGPKRFPEGVRARLWSRRLRHGRLTRGFDGVPRGNVFREARRRGCRHPPAGGWGIYGRKSRRWSRESSSCPGRSFASLVCAAIPISPATSSTEADSRQPDATWSRVGRGPGPGDYTGRRFRAGGGIEAPPATRVPAQRPDVSVRSPACSSFPRRRCCASLLLPPWPRVPCSQALPLPAGRRAPAPP